MSESLANHADSHVRCTGRCYRGARGRLAGMVDVAHAHIREKGPIAFGGYFFGELSFVKNNFSFVVVAIIIISVLPGVYGYLSERKRSKQAEKPIENLNAEGEGQ